jgi:5-methylcytosine-specific restriction enzyme subunit McrC
MGALDDVDDARLTASDLDRLAFTRQAERYRPAVRWARWILSLLAPVLRAGRNEAPALLFDMNRLFEAAVAKLAMGRLDGRRGLRVDAQDRTVSLATMVGTEAVEPAFRLRPDLVFRKAGRVVGIADSKWKRVGLDSKRRLTPSEGDLYQVHAYASAYQCRDLALIYPWHDSLAQAVSGEFRLPLIDGHSPVVRVLCLDVNDDALPFRLGHWPVGSVLDDPERVAEIDHASPLS